MKKITVLIVTIFLYLASTAQSYIGEVEYQKMSRQAIMMEVTFPEKTVLAAIEDTMKKLGFKGRESKGFTMYKGLQLGALGNELLDLSFAVDRKSKSEKNSSVITLVLSKALDEVITVEANPALIEKAKTYLNGLGNSIAVYELETQITAQEEIVKENDKKSSSLADDADDLQKKKKKLDKEIAENAKDQANQSSETEKQKQQLETLKSKRKQ